MAGTAPAISPSQETEKRTRESPRWKVILLNDDITTMDFVVDLLVGLFHKAHPEAKRLMYEVHTTGSAVVEITHKERAELYLEQVRSLARPRGFPLQAVMEPE
jgi:ATP-dependent Clp protease adaptor protein ClpS